MNDETHKILVVMYHMMPYSVVCPKHCLGHVQRWQMRLRMSSLGCELLEGNHGLTGPSLNLEISL